MSKHLLKPGMQDIPLRNRKLSCRNYFLHLVNKQLYRRRKYLIFFPNQSSLRTQWRCERSENERAVPSCIDELVKAQCVSHSAFHHQGCVIDQIIGRYDMHAGQPAGT